MAMTKEEKEILRAKQVKSGLEIGKKNLIPMDKHPIEKQKEWTTKGAQKTNEIKKRKKDIKTICNELLNISALDIAQDVLNADLVEKLKNNDIDITLYDLVVIKQIENAIDKGSVKSAEFLRDSAGDKPTDKIQNDINVISDSDKELMELINDRLNVLEGLHNGKIVDQEPKNE